MDFFGKGIIRNNSEYWVLKTPSFSREKARAVTDTSENWVEEYGRFKTGEEKESDFFEEKKEGSADMPGRRVEGNSDISRLRLKKSSQLCG